MTMRTLFASLGEEKLEMAQHGETALSLTACAAVLAMFGVGSALATPAHSYQVVHDFTGGADGGAPPYTLLVDKKGDFIGTASFGGQNNDGIVFKLMEKDSGWKIEPIYEFTDQDGEPGWGITLVRGSLYTNAGYAEVMGGPCGSALQLNRANAPADAAQRSSVLMHTYVEKEDGCPTGNLVLDRAGNAYGVTQGGGANGWGSVLELTAGGSGWTETILYSFQGGDDGGLPYSGLTFDKAGNLYGTASARGAGGAGTVFELSPSGSSWTFNLVHSFAGAADGAQPVAGLAFDKAGDLVGATTSGGSNGGGTVFELTPAQGSWTFGVLADMTGSDGPVAALTLDSKGAIYGTNFMDGAFGYGSVFKLTSSKSGWVYKDLHDFTGGSDGGYPGGSVVPGADGNLYGTAVLGGADNFGVIYQVAP
jgi:uncharacterized repeat protein (TIGR03803 family)